MNAFRVGRVSHLTLCRQNASLCGLLVRDGIEMYFREGANCQECSRIERESWVREWHECYGILGPIQPAADRGKIRLIESWRRCSARKNECLRYWGGETRAETCDQTLRNPSVARNTQATKYTAVKSMSAVPA